MILFYRGLVSVDFKTIFFLILLESKSGNLFTQIAKMPHNQTSYKKVNTNKNADLKS